MNQRHLENPVVVTVANNQWLTAQRMGSIVLDSVEEDFSLHLNEVLLVPRLGFNLMSSAQLMKNGITLLGEPGKFTLKYGDKKLGTAVEQNGVFVLNFVPERTTADSDNILSLGPWEHRDNIDYTDNTVPHEGVVPTSSTTAAAVMLTFDDQGLNDVENSGDYCQRSTGDPRLILGKGYRHVGLGGYGRTDPLLNKPFYPNGLVVGILTWYQSEGLGFESQCVHFGHPSAGGCQRSTGDPRLILGKGYRHVGLGGWGDTTNMPTNDGIWGADEPDETTWGETPAERAARILAEAEQRVADMEILDSGRLVGVEPVPAASDQESGELILAPGKYVDVEVRVPPPNLTRYVAPALDQIRSDGHQLLLSFFANAEYYLRAEGHKATGETWHQRLGHPSQSTLNNTVKAAVFDKNSLLLPSGLELKPVNRPAPCTICPTANLPHEPVSTARNMLSRSLKLLLDMSGLYRPPTAPLGKFDQRAKWGLHLDVEKQYFAWRIMDYRSRPIVPARDCIFYENLTLPVFEQHLASLQNPATLFHDVRSFANADVEIAASEEPDSDGAREAAPDPPDPVTIPEFIPLADAAPEDVREVAPTKIRIVRPDCKFWDSQQRYSTVLQ
ncbi:unnamed protein product [Closterium sp. NIES-54]